MRGKQTLISIAVIVFVIVGFLARLSHLSTPLADWHSWRQADTASVAREYVKHGIDLLHPTYHDLSTIPSGKENPAGYRMVEFPLINAFVAWVYSTIPGLTNIEIHVVYRMINILFSLVSAIMLYVILKRLESSFTGLLAMIVFLFIPYNVFYSRTVLPEIAMVTFALAAVYTGIVYFEEKQLVQFVLTALLAAIALLIKPVAIFLLFPLIPYAVRQYGWKKTFSWQQVILAIIAITPLLLWRRWITQYPEGIPASDWLYNGNGIRFKGAFFQWIFADRIGRIILGYWGVILLGLGLLAKKKTCFSAWMTVSALAYLVIFATGNVQHDYYQIPIIPAISILIAYGIQYLRRVPAAAYARYSLLMVTIAFSLAFGWYHVRGLYQINNPAIVEAGKAVDQLTPKDALVIAPYNGDTAFLYQTNRRGWPIGGDIDKKVAAGATYYVTTSLDDEAKKLQQTYPTIASSSAYTIIHLIKQSP